MIFIQKLWRDKYVNVQLCGDIAKKALLVQLINHAL